MAIGFSFRSDFYTNSGCEGSGSGKKQLSEPDRRRPQSSVREDGLNYGTSPRYSLNPEPDT
jgi:hypothetical protein